MLQSAGYDPSNISTVYEGIHYTMDQDNGLMLLGAKCMVGWLEIYVRYVAQSKMSPTDFYLIHTPLVTSVIHRCHGVL